MTTTAVKPARFPWYRYDRYSFSLGVKIGHRTFLSGHTASEHDAAIGRMVVKGGMGEQARTAWAKIGAILEGAGQAFSDVVRVVEYVTEAGIARYAEAAAVREEVVRVDPTGCQHCPVKRLLRPEAFIEIEVTAGARRHGGRSARRQRVVGRRLPPVDAPGRRRRPNRRRGRRRSRRRGPSSNGPGGCCRRSGLDLDHVVKTLDYLTPAALAELQAHRARSQGVPRPRVPRRGGDHHAAPARRRRADAVDFIAVAMTPVAVNPGWARYGKLTYSPAVRAGNMLFMSGQGAVDPETERVVHDGRRGRPGRLHLRERPQGGSTPPAAARRAS